MRLIFIEITVGCVLLSGCLDPIELDDEGGSTNASAEESTTGTPPNPTTSTTSATTTMGTTPMTGPPPTASAVTTEVTTIGTDTATTDLPECPGVGAGPLGVGDPCVSNAECSSALCTLYSDAPLNPDAVCDVPPVDCSMRITGTVRDIVTQQPVADADVIAAAVLQAATNPTGAMALASDVSGGDGRIDTETAGPPSGPIGLVVLGELPGFTLTGTELAIPGDDGTSYGVANDVHDFWVVSDNAATAWSNMLALDPAIDPASLPLGDSGGVVGLVRDSSGTPVAGAAVTSTDGASSTIVRFLNLDGTFNESATTDLGLFVILDPALAEQFEVTVAGMVLGGGTAVSTSGAIFTLAVDLP